MDWTPIIVSVLTVIFGSGGVLVTFIQHNKTRDKKHEKTDRNVAEALKLLRDLQTNQSEIKKELRDNSYATKKQIKYTLTRLHRELVTRGFISRYELECAEDLYTEYKRLDGNSFIDTVMREMRELDIKFSLRTEEPK
jgi:hypothetical protein